MEVLFMKKFLCAVLFVLVLAGLSYAIEDAGTVSFRDFVAQTRNSVKLERLYLGKYVTVTGCAVSNIHAKGNDYVLTAHAGVDFVYFIFTAADAEQLVDLDQGDVVTIRGIVQRNQYGF
ncbi:MAG: hypothetical protein IJP88_08645, partial [Synergistaceae bacterium]|nr:hypothetical protein [Synergistaceae bacterium]